jgi:hypothetical protein
MYRLYHRRRPHRRAQRLSNPRTPTSEGPRALEAGAQTQADVACIVIPYAILLYANTDRAMQINEVFKILDGRIRLIDNIGLMGEGIKTSGFTQ